ncbi:MAG: hypothetical protein WCJ30_06365, partial [Deltaproteobacteria bacterium]
ASHATRVQAIAATWRTVPLPASLDLEGSTNDFRHRVRRADPMDPESIQHWLAGSLRASVEGREVRWATDLTLSGITSATHDGDRWYFATQDGALFASAGFLGPLERVAESGTQLTGFLSTGRVVALGADGTFWSGGPGDRFEPLRPPVGTTWVDAGFVSSSVGFGIAETGALYRTVDGGATFVQSAVDGSGYRVRPARGAIEVDTTAGSFRVDEAGVVGPWVEPPLEAPFIARTALDERFVVHGWLRSHPLSRARLLASHDAFELPDGTLVTLVNHSLVYVRGDGTLDAVDAGGSTMHIDRPGCAILRLGARPIAFCAGDQAVTVREPHGASSWRDVRTFPRRGRCIIANDSGLLGCPGPCEATAAPGDHSTCWSDGGPWTTRTAPLPEATAAFAGRAFAWFGDDHGTETLLHARMDDDLPPAPMRFTPAAATAVFVSRAGDSRFCIVARQGERRLAGAGPAGSTIELSPLPEGALSARFADAQHAVAVGATMSHVWLSEDGGRTWTPMESPIDADLESTRLVTDSDREEAVFCTARGCVIGDRVFWGPDAPAGLRGLDARHAGPPSPAPSNRMTPLRVFRFDARCGHDDAPRPIAAPPESRGNTTRSFHADGWTDFVDVAPHSDVGFDARIAWHGVDARGVYDVTSGPRRWEFILDYGAHRSTPPAILPVDSTRTRLIAQRCIQTETGNSLCVDLVVARRGREPAIIPLASVLHTVDAARYAVTVRGSVARPDGGSVIHVALESGSLPNADVLLRLDAHDHAEVLRTFSWDINRPQRLLAVLAGRIGLAVFRRDDSGRFEFHDADATVPLARRAWRRDAPATVCTAGASHLAPDDVELITNALPWSASLRIGSDQPVEHLLGSGRWLARADGSTCMRALSWSDRNGPHAADAPVWLQAVADARGRLAGSVVMGDTIRPVQCVLQTP